jgi:tRNA-specific 2-thiouridylase
MKTKKALALFSGGLDSMLAIKLMKMQNIDVTAININIGFGSRVDISDTMRKRAIFCGADFDMIDVRDEYISKILFNPKYGYGKHFNPCIDCHGYMFKVALALLPKYKADFIVTGEVVGQRPMSQRVDALRSVKKLAIDSENLILRPLSAKIMDITKPEKEGWVDREKLLGISGRGRETQLKMAKEFGWEYFESPGGGCLLTDERFAKKMREFLKHDKLQVEDIDILKNGRHLRLPDGAKLVIGRDKAENEFLEKAKNSKYLKVKANDIPGPYSLVSSNATENDLNLSARLTLTFAKTKPKEIYSVEVGDKIIKTSPLSKREEAHEYFVI